MEQRVTAITLGVADLARARRFYEEGLGWRRGNDHVVVAFYQLPGMILSLFSRDSLAEDAKLPATGSGFSGITIAHNCRDRAGVDAVLAQAEAAGATILKPAEDAAWGGYGGYFADPDGHVWEVAWNPGWPLDAEGTPRL
jgi:hypothetical protein